MKLIISLLFISVGLTGCVTYQPPVPADYVGPRAIIKDSVKVHSNSKADFFHVSQLDGKDIENSLIRTRVFNHGRGIEMTPVVIQREIPARTTKLSIRGRTEYGAPVLAFANAVYEIKGDVEFTPEPNKVYKIQGELGENYSAVWIEEESTNAVVGKKIEVQGSTALGFFAK